MRHSRVDHPFVRADERAEIQCRIVDAKLLAAAEQRLRDINHGRFAHVIRPGLEAEAEQHDLLLTRALDERQQTVEMSLITW